MGGNMDFTGTWGTYPCFDINLIHEADRKTFSELPNGSLLYRCTGESPESIILEYGSARFKANSSVYKPQKPPAFTIGEEVIVTAKNFVHASITGIFWHFGENAPYYTLAVAGKNSSRRYWDSELQKLPAAISSNDLQ